MGKTRKGSGKRVVIIGTGIGGLSTAIALKENLGLEDVNLTIFEKASDVGGTWRENTYPGAGSDVQVHLYSLSTELRPHWDADLATQPELLAYWRALAAKHGLRRNIVFNTRVVGAEWDAAQQLYHVTVQRLADPDCAKGMEEVMEIVVDAEVVISAIGVLEQPRFPDIAGMGEFKGEWFHSARWEPDVRLAGRRVAVIGSGSSATQFVPKLTEDPTTEVVQFIRTPSWYAPRAKQVFSGFAKWIFAHVPGAMRVYRSYIYLQRERIYFAVFRASDSITRKVKQALLGHLHHNCPDEYREAMTPDFPPGCKRLLADSGYLSTLNRPNVSLKFGGVSRLTSTGVETKQGEQIPFDVVIFATGFSVDKYPIHITGIDGATVQGYYEAHGGPTAYLGTTIPGLPNFYMVAGPNTVTGHTSVVFTEEVQIQYILKMVAPVLSSSASSFVVTPAACDAYNAKIQRRLEGSVLTQCVSWYRTDGTGKVTNFFPGPVTLLWWWMRKPVWGDYEVVGGERWRAERRTRKVKRAVGIAALAVASVGLSRNWEAVESGAKVTWGMLENKHVSDVIISLREAVIGW
ncbi:FAD/NAD-binding domain-containing protein [Athelia psychrophila]|uniref:FAD/NAD-binding domain-containing protein n=1 Tax=Athelia psychrophila TaxID=1759441 RepID=A0A166FV68_9AGAM|nr:FAD/NAD-binding domain-containing protein [Fibularhizoctonia sp. CBS 109695]